jgi:hypothetical protein
MKKRTPEQVANEVKEISNEVIALLDYHNVPFPTACNSLAHTVGKLMRKDNINLNEQALSEFSAVFSKAILTGWTIAGAEEAK